MVSDGLKDFMRHLREREEISAFTSQEERLRALLHEFDEDDMRALIICSTHAADYRAQGDPHTHEIAMLIIGLEIGRELERRI